MKLLGHCLPALALAAGWAGAAQALTFASSSTGVSASTAVNGVASLSASSPTTAGSGSAAYNLVGNPASIYVGGNVAPDPLRLGSSISVAASGAGAQSSATSDGSTVAQGLFTSDGGQVGLTQPSLGSLFNLGFTSLTSSSTVSLTGGNFLTNGSTDILGLSLSGSLLGAGLGATDFTKVAANTVLLSLTGLRVVLNEQVASSNAAGGSLQTNAIHVFYKDLALGNGNALTGDVIYGHTDAAISPAAVPEPASWAMLLVGFGAVGTALRRRARVLSTL